MRSMSPRMTPNRVDVYAFIKTAAAFDADAGVNGPAAYAGTPDFPAVPCRVNADYALVEELSQGRVTTVREYLLMFDYPTLSGLGLAFGVRDKIVWTDGGGLTLFADGSIDAAGEHAVTEVRARERA